MSTSACLERFAVLVASGVTAPDAYQRAGVALELGITVRQTEQRSAERVAELRRSGSVVAAAAKPAEESVREMLLADRDLARSTGQASAAVKAAELVGKLDGLFIERKQVDMNVSMQLASRLDEAIRRVAGPVVEVVAVEVGGE
jgi:ribosomal protein S4